MFTVSQFGVLSYRFQEGDGHALPRTAKKLRRCSWFVWVPIAPSIRSFWACRVVGWRWLDCLRALSAAISTWSSCGSSGPRAIRARDWGRRRDRDLLEGRYFDLATDDYLREEVRTQLGILRMRREQYTGAHAAVDPEGRTVIIVDDGVATESSVLSAIRSVRARKPKKVVVAIAVAPPSSLARIEGEADEVVCLYTSEDFFAVAQFFDDFSNVTDDIVAVALTRPQHKIARQPT